MTKKEKRLRNLKEKLIFYESKLNSRMRDYEGEIPESITSKLNHQEVIMLNVAIEDIEDEIEALEA